MESKLSLLSRENGSPVLAILLSGHKAHLNRLCIRFQLMKFGFFFRAKFSSVEFPFFPSAF